ncbi:hypothetical protein [Labrys monachus]|uniref:Glutamine amidotransferase domain-containing protein n=1 Tax=Labrys monachus TaxID=217067 RepID=A0ABU0FJN5_9HYPH|nr:hypothetical protein [Labrys monachus]MDQ0394696.1 hypothetical protein [Labrys monachus]
MADFSLQFAPLLPWAALAAATVLAAAVALAGVLGRVRGAWLRVLALGLFVLALFGPVLSREDRSFLPSVVALIVDRSASQGLADRTQQTDAARDALARQIKALGNTELRVVEAGADSSGADGTQLFGALSSALSDVPPDRVGGAILLTDGIVHDVPAKAAELGFKAPVHALITGRPDERDRQIDLVEAPRFGLVKHATTIRFRVIDHGPGMPSTSTVVLRRDGEEIARTEVPVGQLSSIDVPIDHPGVNIVELDAEAVPGELSQVNNRAVLQVEGIREKMRVLLISGEPNAGERTWRNLLKADANVDLVHFTILRPPQKGDGTPINELSLIQFPTHRLFDEEINGFDLIIFDRYAQEGLLPPAYFDNMTEFVRNGGAILLASGADYASDNSLWGTGLADILPAAPTGNVIYQPFRPQITDLGRRHPVTRDLPGGNSNPPAWGEWFTTVETTLRGGTAVMSGAHGAPLLVLAHQDKGRVALLLSDHAWLWARGYEGGGPHVDLLRRLSHWLMKEPDLDEEALRAHAQGRDLTIERQTMADKAQPVELTGPNGEKARLVLKQEKPGLWTGTYATGAMGLWHAGDGTLQAIANVGPANPREFRDLISTDARLKGLAAQTGGTVRRLASGTGLSIPVVRAIDDAASYGGDDWIGLKRSEASVVRGISTIPIFAGLIGLALLLGSLAMLWTREGR